VCNKPVVEVGPSPCPLPISSWGSKIGLINCAPIVLQLFSIVLVPLPRIFRGGLGLRILDSKQRESIIVLNCAAFFFNCTGSFFQLPGGVVFRTQPPPPSRISDSKQRESIVLQLCSNVLQLFSIVFIPFLQLPGGWISELYPHPHCDHIAV